MLKRLAIFAAMYTGLGLAAGLYYREMTKHREPVVSQLSTTHTHFLALGTLVFLIVLGLERAFALSKQREFTWFIWIYNAGLLLSTTMMLVHGTQQVLGPDPKSPAIAGIAGLGHILLTLGFIALFMALIKQAGAADRERELVAAETPAA